MTCKEFIEEFLADYLDGALQPAAVAELEAHIAACRPCVAYLNTFRRAREIPGQVGRIDMPPEMQTLLRQFLRTHLEKSAD